MRTAGESWSSRARAIRLRRRTPLRRPRLAISGAEVGGQMYWLKAVSRRAPSADRFMPGPSGMSPDRLLKDLIKASKKVEKLGSEEIRGVTDDALPRAPRQVEARERRQRRTSRASSTPGSTSKGSRDGFASRTEATTTRPPSSTCSISAFRSTSRPRPRTRSSPRRSSTSSWRRNAPTSARTSRTRIRCACSSVPPRSLRVRQHADLAN